MKKVIIISSIVILSSILIWTYVGCLQKAVDFTSSGSLHFGVNEKDAKVIGDSCLNEITELAGYTVQKKDVEFASYPMKDKSHLIIWRILKDNRTNLSEKYLIEKSSKVAFDKKVTYVKDAFRFGDNYINLYKSNVKNLNYLLVGGNYDVYTSTKDTLHFEGRFDFLNLSKSKNEAKIKYQGVLFENIPTHFSQEVIMFNDEHGLVICTYIGKESESIKNILK